jgi:hypothetical protein
VVKFFDHLLDTLYSADFSFSKVSGDEESGDVRLMEDFLYERPFVNLGLFVSDFILRSVEPGATMKQTKRINSNFVKLACTVPMEKLLHRMGKRIIQSLERAI